MSDATGADPYPPIQDLAVIGDGRSLALIDRQATIVWMALPEDDRIAIFDSLLDATEGGRWTLAPTGEHEAHREYLHDTAMVRTTFRTEGGTATVTDAFTLHNGAVLPWVELARRVELVDGQVELGGASRPPASSAPSRWASPSGTGSSEGAASSWGWRCSSTATPPATTSAPGSAAGSISVRPGRPGSSPW